jgi:hypothetical protein
MLRKIIPPETRFGKLIVLRPGPVQHTGGKGHSTSVCQCDCGSVVTVRNSILRYGPTESCGCRQSEGQIRHGHCVGKSQTRTYSRWAAMVSRCTDPNSRVFIYYSARGISICEAWRNSFEQFLADMGECPPGLELDRWPNNNGNYEPGNCRWATRSEQMRNTRQNLIVTVGDFTGCFAAACDHFSVPWNRTWCRIYRYGWSIEAAFGL